MTNALTNPAFNLPAHLQDFGNLSIGINEGITGGLRTGGHPRIDFTGRMWTLKENGASEPVNSLTLDVIIVGANPTVSKVFYKSKYNPAATEVKAPECWSDNGTGPSIQASEPQCGTCALCPNNAWGSKVNELGNKTKACSDYKKIAVVLADDPERNVYELRIPAASLGDFNKIMSRIVNNKLPIPALVFQLSFDPSVVYPKVMFKPTGYVDEGQKNSVSKWVNSLEATEAVGANDTARPAQATIGQAATQYQRAEANAAAILNAGTQVNYVPQTNSLPPRPPAAAPAPQPQNDPLAGLSAGTAAGVAAAQPRRGRPPKVAQEPVMGQGIPAAQPTGQLNLDLPGAQAAAQATPINPTRTNADLDALLAGVLD